MEQVHRRRRSRHRNTNAMLLALIGALVVLLIVAILVAASLGRSNQEDNPQQDSTGASAAPSVPDTQPLTQLQITSPEKTQMETGEEQLVFAGIAEPTLPLTINGVAVDMTTEGRFQHPVALAVGDNTVTVVSGDTTRVYQIRRYYGIQSYSPSTDTTYSSGATVLIEVMVREDSRLQVTLGTKEIEMKKDPNQIGSGISQGYVRYTGSYKLTDTNAEDLQLGVITYTVTTGDVVETYESRPVVCKKSGQILSSNPSVTPDYGEYMDVGSGFIAEIIAYNAETFNGKTNDDKSSPLRNYLPEGTLDYASTKQVTNSGNSYYLLRCGRRVYVKKNNWPSSAKTQIVDVYKGTLPDHNEIGFVSMTQDGHHTVLTFDTMWKAPFYFDLLPQKYNNEEERDYRVEQLTAEYVDITFCYATVFEGSVEIPEGHRLFKSAELKKNESDCTLRLYLQKTGGFYGWDAYYNEQNQLCFRFLNPVKATETADNAYGADLTGIRIMLDVGHGGIDPGSIRKNFNGKTVTEAELNLALANKLKQELEAMGATVILNRTGDTTINTDERIQQFKEISPDLCIAIHQNSVNGYPNHSGVEICYSTPFSASVAELIFAETEKTEVYKKNSLKWHYYYVARQTNCPVVLTENGFMSNDAELQKMMDEGVQLTKAQAMARGIAQYFLSIE